jgi:thiol-disulfide isomerase/thioredoxin
MDVLKTGLIASGVTLVTLLVFVGLYWVFRGYPPASRMIVEEVKEIGIPDDKAHLLFFYTEWCPYSQDAIPTMNSLSAILKDRTYGGKKIDIQHINCESDKKCAEFKVDSYPTYKLQTSSKTFEYVGPPKTEVLREFLVEAVGPELAVGGSSNAD